MMIPFLPATPLASAGKLRALGALLLAAGWTASAATVPSLSYNRDIKPLLSEYCFTCHGTDSAARKAGLRLDQFGSATNRLEDGKAAIVPGKPASSEMIRRINLTDDDQMPPAKVNKVLSPEQKSRLQNWIAAGAKYEPHWSVIPPSKTAPPKVSHPRWVRNPIDQFILARLDQAKLKPNPEADRRTLIRRVTLDLTGLPPTPDEVDRYLADRSPDAYEKVVDRLLTSPRWGEHRARYWLDVARYGDTHGIHFDNYRETWAYREWVIRAFDRNLPFDQFTLQNLAGDLLPNATLDEKIGSGFNRCHITSNEGGLIDEEYYVLYARDRTDTTAQAWLGLSAGCAVCHDHKYDPLTQKDFYSMSAFFNHTTQKAMDGNIKDTPPVIVVPKDEDRSRWDQLAREIPAADQALADHRHAARADFTNWLAKPDFSQLASRPTEQGRLFHLALDEGAGEVLHATFAESNQVVSLGGNTNWQAGAVAERAYTTSGRDAPTFPAVGDFERTNAFSYAAWVRLDKQHRDGAIFARMTDEDGHFTGWDLWVEGGKPGTHILHEWPGDAIKVVSRKELPEDRWSFVCVTYNGSSKADGVKIYINGELQAADIKNDNLQSSIHTEVPFRLGQRDSSFVLAQAGLQDLSLFGRELPAEEVAGLMTGPRTRWLTSRPPASRTAAESDELFEIWLPATDAAYRQQTSALAGLRQEESQIRLRGTVAYVMNELTTPPEAYVLNRGQYDQRRERVEPNTPAFLPPMPADLPRNRLGFAQWLLRPENPLTARVTVNRFWQELFGTGIVKTTGDFGVAGEPPTHPELLDWLAVDFREHGWDVKRMYKLMVMSATYRQSALATPEKIERDPGNRLLARGPRFRMDAEMVRDYALAASGLLVEKIGGPSTRPYQPPGIWSIVGMPEGDTRNYIQDHGDNLYRRSLYTFWKRQAPPASMEIFNAPSRETCTVRRERTDTPLQALVTLNDPQFVEAARKLAEASLQAKDHALDFMAERLLARPLTPAEKKIVEASARDLLAHYRQAPKEADQLLAVGEAKPAGPCDPPLLATYTMVANELFNLDEVLNK